jgi:hypothetical protein
LTGTKVQTQPAFGKLFETESLEEERSELDEEERGSPEAGGTSLSVLLITPRLAACLQVVTDRSESHSSGSQPGPVVAKLVGSSSSARPGVPLGHADRPSSNKGPVSTAPFPFPTSTSCRPPLRENAAAARLCEKHITIFPRNADHFCQPGGARWELGRKANAGPCGPA